MNKRRAVVHIGIHKTGSSAIQSALYGARVELLKQTGLMFPSVTANLSSRLLTSFQDSPRTLRPIDLVSADRRIDYSRAASKALETIDRDLTKNDWETLVISAESLESFDLAAVSRFLDWLSQYVTEVLVVAYIRHPVSWTRSAVQQRVSGRGVAIQKSFANLPLVNWKQKLTPWIDSVGQDNFKLVSFEEASRDNALMESFFDAAEIPREPALSIAPAQRTNESISREAMLILDRINRRQRLFDDNAESALTRRDIFEIVRGIPGQKFQLPARQALRAKNKSRPDVRWIQETFGVDWYSDVLVDSVVKEPTYAPMSEETADAIGVALGTYGSRLTRQNAILREQNLELRAKLQGHPDLES